MEQVSESQAEGGGYKECVLQARPASAELGEERRWKGGGGRKGMGPQRQCQSSPPLLAFVSLGRREREAWDSAAMSGAIVWRWPPPLVPGRRVPSGGGQALTRATCHAAGEGGHGVQPAEVGVGRAPRAAGDPSLLGTLFKILNLHVYG